MSDTVTKKVLIERLILEHEVDEELAKVLVNEFFKSIVDIVKTGNVLCLNGFGSFLLKEKNARVGRNPRTGEEYRINERKVVTFKSSAIFRERLNSVNITDC